MKNQWGGWSLQTKLFLCIIAANLVIMAITSLGLYDAVKNRRHAERIAEINTCAEPFFKAIEALSFERGRSNVILAAETPISEQNRQFILGRRKLADSNLQLGLERLRRIDSALAERLLTEYKQFQLLQSQLDEQARLPLARRNPAIRDEWIRQSTDFIFFIREIIDSMGRRERRLGVFDIYHHFQLNCVEFRLFSGYSATVLTAAIATGKPLSPTEYQTFLESRAKADYLWQQIHNDSADFNNPILEETLLRVYHKYYQIYRPMQTEILAQQLVEAAPKEWGERLADLSVPAFDSIFDLITVIDRETRAHVEQLTHKAERDFRIALFQFFLTSFFVTLFLVFFRTRLFAPLGRIVEGLQNILDGQPIANLDPDAQRQDEIGLLARGTITLQGSIREERRLRELNQRLATTDHLTGLFNREMLDQLLDNALAQADRYREPLSMILFDLDHFKAVNDTWGHPVGDEVLVQTAQTVKSVIRGADLLIRFGGEEFLILMPNTMAAGAVAAAEKIRIRLSETSHPSAGVVTASFGVAERAVGEEFADWYKRTDDALYQAKKIGRNCTVCHGSARSTTAPLHLQWIQEWESGQPEIDVQHRMLVAMANEYFAVALNPRTKPDDALNMLASSLRELVSHFEFEERLLEQIGYPNVEQHRRIHLELLAKAATLRESYQEGKIKLPSFVSFLVDDVVIAHMLQEDRLYYPLIREKFGADKFDL